MARSSKDLVFQTSCLGNRLTRDMPSNEKVSRTDPPHRRIPAVSAVLDEGTIVELLNDPSACRTHFGIWRAGEWRTRDEFTDPLGNRRVPYSSTNSLIRHRVILLPSQPQEYATEDALVAEVRNFIHRYVDLDPGFERLASYYVLLSWVYDAFNEVPYLRIRGDFGSGKTRFLLIVGSLCYTPMFASGASTVSPLFHMLDTFRGTLILDEADFRFSDEKADIVKILNNGNVRGMPVLRAEVSKSGEYNPRAFDVFGPKLIATRGYYDDRALESRFISCDMGRRPLRPDIPINLPSAYRDEALHLRNKLLLYRFRTLEQARILPELADRRLDARINQVFIPLLSIVRDEAVRRELAAFAAASQEFLDSERAWDLEAQLIGILLDLFTVTTRSSVAVKDVTAAFIQRFGREYEHAITNKWIGTALRRRLSLRTRKSHGTFVIPLTEAPKIRALAERYGLTSETEDTGTAQTGQGDVGDVGDNVLAPETDRLAA